MPILIENSNYTNAFGYSGATYVSNVGDKSMLTVTVAELIRITTIGNPFSFDPILNILTSQTVSWVSEGIRVGDIVRIRKYTSAGVLSQTHNATVTNVTATQLNLDTWASGLFYDISANEIMEVVPVVSIGGAPRRRDDLLIEFNHSLNNEMGSSASLIDGEKTQIFFGGLNSLAVSGVVVGAIVGNQSGQFLLGAEIEYLGLNADGFNQYEISFEFVNSGLYNPEDFTSGECLKIFLRGLWSSLSGEVFNRAEFRLDEQANTGYFGQANSISVPDVGGVIAGITTLNYNEVNTVAIEVELGTTDIEDLALGGCYISIDDTYFKNKPTSQNKLSLLIPTTAIEEGETYTSFDYLGREWSVLVYDISVVGTVATVILEITFNAELQSFLEGKEEDRLFNIWVKVGNINHLIYGEQLFKALPSGGELTMNSDFGFLDHSQNVTEISGDLTGYEADLEDDLAYYGTFNLEKNKTTYRNLNVRVEAFNLATDESFILQQTNFGFGGVVFQNSTGKYLLNQSVQINSNLLNTSLKQNAVVKLTGVEDAESYEVSVYYPFLLNWRYWQTLQGVNSDFAPNYNNNWFPYGNTGAWEVRVTIDLIDNGLSFKHSNTIEINNYNADANITTSINLRRITDNTVVGFIPQGEDVIIESVHELVSGAWDIQKIWGQITVEPKEGAQRWMLSSIIDFDNNTNNPLAPISGSLLNLVYIFPNIIKFSCKFDAGKIDTSNGVKITAKIKEGLTNIVLVNKITNDEEDKITTDNETKILA